MSAPDTGPGTTAYDPLVEAREWIDHHGLPPELAASLCDLLLDAEWHGRQSARADATAQRQASLVSLRESHLRDQIRQCEEEARTAPTSASRYAWLQQARRHRKELER